MPIPEKREALSSIEPAPLVDVHAHVYRTAMPSVETAWHLPKNDATIEDYIATLDAANVTFGVLAAASIYGDYNDYTREALRAHKRLRGTAIVKPDIDPYVLRMMNDDGFVGIRLQFRNVASPPDLSSYEYKRLFGRIADLGWHVHLHDEGARLPQYIRHIEAAGPRLVIDHFGRPTAGMGVSSKGFRAVLESVEGGRTWVKLSAAFRIEPAGAAAEFSAALLMHAGPERLLWGSDWPFAAFEDRMTYAAVLAQYRENVPDVAIRREIDRTALKFYFT